MEIDSDTLTGSACILAVPVLTWLIVRDLMNLVYEKTYVYWAGADFGAAFIFFMAVAALFGGPLFWRVMVGLIALNVAVPFVSHWFSFTVSGQVHWILSAGIWLSPLLGCLAFLRKNVRLRRQQDHV